MVWACLNWKKASLVQGWEVWRLRRTGAYHLHPLWVVWERQSQGILPGAAPCANAVIDFRFARQLSFFKKSNAGSTGAYLPGILWGTWGRRSQGTLFGGRSLPLCLKQLPLGPPEEDFFSGCLVHRGV